MPFGDPVTSVLGDKLKNTAMLALATMILLLPISFLLGVASAVRAHRPLDHGIALSTLALVSIPDFVVGSVLIATLSVWLGLFPPVSLIDATRPLEAQMSILVLPVLTLLAASVAQTIRMIRAVMIETLRSDFVEMARLKGVPEGRVLWRHALPNALAPIIQVFALNIAWLLGGVIVVETLFDWRGVGLGLSEAVARRDLPTVQAIGLLAATIYVGLNLLADVLVIVSNPRLRRQL
jgi:peptide/nickel transport system permease protein